MQVIFKNFFTKIVFLQHIGSKRILTKLGQPGTLDDLIEIERVTGNPKVDYKIKQKATNDKILGHYKWIGQDGAILTAGQSGNVPPGILRKFTDYPADTIINPVTDKYERNQYYFHQSKIPIFREPFG